VTPGVLVSRGLVDKVFSGANPLGRRIKYVGRSPGAPSSTVALERWYAIVGVVPDFAVPGPFDDESEGRVYHAVAAVDLYPARLNVRVRTGDPAALADPLRDLSASIDPDVLLLDVSAADIAFRQAQGMMRLMAVSLALVILSVLLHRQTLALLLEPIRRESSVPRYRDGSAQGIRLRVVLCTRQCSEWMSQSASAPKSSSAADA
jgi:hypothetical protein